MTQSALRRLGRVGESVTICGPATNPLCALEQVTSVFGPQFTICKKISLKDVSWVSAAPRALGQVLLQAEPQFPYLDHKVIEVVFEDPGC